MDRHCALRQTSRQSLSFGEDGASHQNPEREGKHNRFPFRRWRRGKAEDCGTLCKISKRESRPKPTRLERRIGFNGSTRCDAFDGLRQYALGFAGRHAGGLHLGRHASLRRILRMEPKEKRLHPIGFALPNHRKTGRP